MIRPQHAAAWFSLLPIVLLAACEKTATEVPAASAPEAKPAAAASATVAAAGDDPAQPAAADAKKPDEEPPFAKVEGERGLRTHLPAALDGYTLISPLNSKLVHLVDMAGKTAHTWETKYVPAGGVYFLPNGHLLRTAMIESNPRFHAGGIGGRIEELDWNGKLVWEYELATDQRTTHHDISRLPNGNILAIAWEYHAPEEIFDHGRSPNRVHEEGLWCDMLLEIKPTLPSGGEIVWQWRSFDHLVQDVREKGPNFGDPKDFPGRIDINADHRFDPPETEEERKAREEREKQIQGLGYTGGKDEPKDGAKPADGAAKKPKKKDEKYDADWLHMNAIEYLPELDLIAVSTPHLCEVWVIDHSTTSAQAAGSSGGKRGHGGDLLYRYGHSRNYGIGEKESRKLFYQHNVTWQPGAKPGELSMLVFNNGSGRKEKEHNDKEYSEVEQFTLPFDPASGFTRKPGEAFGPTELTWSYNDPERFFSPFISGAQRLSNGNTLICEGARGRVFEVTRAGEIVWDFYNPLGGEVEPAEQAGKAPKKALFRATRIAKDHPGLAGKF